MKIAVTITRILLGVSFVLFGVLPFLPLTVPTLPGLAGTFNEIFYRSHWIQFVGAVELLAGVLLLVNRYVALALVILGAIIFNILVFHITMQPAGIAPGLVVLALWLFLAFQMRTHFEPLLAAKTTAKRP